MAHSGFKDVLKNGGFQAFLWTQFLGAFNDNAYRILVSLRAVDLVQSPELRDKYLAAATAVFVLPSLLFTGYAGHLADAVSKRKVLIAVKAFEILVMAAGIVTLRSSSVAWMFVVLFLMAVHSTVFSPAKYSIVPEIVAERDLSRANALLEMSTLVAIVMGIASGTFLYTRWTFEAWKIGVVLLGIATVGFLASLRITRVPAAGTQGPFQLNPFSEVVTGTRHLLRDRPMWLSVLGISYFWFIGACVQRFIRFMVWKPYYDMKSLNWFLRKAKAIPVGTGGARAMVHAIRTARQELKDGHVVCIFAEGAISRTGNMLPFKRGMETIVEGLDVPIIPVHLDRMWGSIFSFEHGRFFWKWPRRMPYPVTVSFGAPMPAKSAAHEVRQAIQELSAAAVAHRQTRRDTLGLRMVRNARRNWKRFAMADSTGRELTYGRMLTGGILVAKWVRRASAREEMIGVMLPPTVAGALVNVGITLAGRIPVNLNFTAGREGMDAAVDQCDIRAIVTSKAFLAKAKLDPMPDMVYVEDILGGVSQLARLRALLAARLLPANLICSNARPESLATVIFSSGSTGQPKGVMLSHYNLLANIEAIGQVFWIGTDDRIVGVLPFFHSFGYTVTIWFPLIAGCGVVYHPNPVDAKAIGDLIRKYNATLLLSTPTFCTTYTRKCSPEDFASLRFVLVGAEKLRAPVAEAFREKFGLELLEGYGCTEMAPCVAVNAPNFEAEKDSQLGNKPGTVGHPLPGVAARIVDPVTFAPLPANTEGLLLVNGSNRMLGYLGQPARTAEVFRGDWYITGDIALIDDEGFLHITDRLSRFSKIGGEMVPHIRVEEAIGAVIGDAPCAVTAVADDQRGERLVAMYVSPAVSPANLWQKLAATDLPRLWLPKRENIYQVENLPVLGTGKLDLRGVKNLAQQLACGAGCQPTAGC